MMPCMGRAAGCTVHVHYSMPLGSVTGVASEEGARMGSDVGRFDRALV